MKSLHGGIKCGGTCRSAPNPKLSVFFSLLLFFLRGKLLKNFLIVGLPDAELHLGCAGNKFERGTGQLRDQQIHPLKEAGGTRCLSDYIPWDKKVNRRPEVQIKLIM